jgi:hypothetical protein
LVRNSPAPQLPTYPHLLIEKHPHEQGERIFLD